MADQDGSDPSKRTAWAGALAGMVLAIPALFLSVLSGGAGHGDYLFARALFPVPMLLTFNASINPLAFLAALIQFPVYGWIVGQAMTRRDWKLAKLVVALHGVGILLCFSGVIPNFS